MDHGGFLHSNYNHSGPWWLPTVSLDLIVDPTVTRG